MIRRDLAREVRLILDDAHELCDRLDLLGGRHGHTWTRTPRGVTILCPAHEERTPSCSVRVADDGTLACCCFACGWTADALGLIAIALHLDITTEFVEVLREGCALAGIPWESRDAGSWTPRPRPARPAPAPDPTLDGDTFDRIATIILDACPIEGERAVAEYLESRKLLRPAVSAGWAALPSDPRELTALRDRIVAEVGHEAWLLSGLAVREGDRAGAWVYAAHQLVIPWRARGVAGIVETIQRRTLGAPPEGVGKYVFASGRRPSWPYGAELFDEESGAEVPVYLVEGAVDSLALRALLRKMREPGVVLGLPGVASWSGETAARWAPMCRERHVVIALDAEAETGRAAKNVAAAAHRIRLDLSLEPAAKIEKLQPIGGHHDWADAWAAGGNPKGAVA